MKYANYDKTTGKLLGWYDDEIHGTYVPEVPAVTDMDGKVITKAVPAHYDISSIPKPNIAVTEADWQTAINNNYNYVDATTKTLSYKDFSTFAEKQTAKIQEIETSYNTANQADIAYMNTTFQADKASQDLIVSVLSAGSVPTGFFWLDKANNKVPMTYAQLQGLSGAILARGQANFNKRLQLKTQVKQATTQAELDAIQV